MNRLLGFLLGIALGLPLLASAQAPQSAGSPVAIVSDAQGEAFVMEKPGPVRLTLLRELQPGQVLRLDAGSKVIVVFLPGGQVYEISGAGRFRVGAKSIEPLDARNPPRKRELPSSLQHLAVKPSDISQGAVIMRGGAVSERVVLIRPSNSISSQQGMVFEWRPVATTVYHFLLVDEQGNKTVEADVAEPRYELPAGMTLAEGRPYVWVVSARNQRGVTTESAAEFTILPSVQRNALEAARPNPDADFTERLVFALALEQRGLKDEAQRYWSELASDRPELRPRVER
jgi:hypothetical protein